MMKSNPLLDIRIGTLVPGNVNTVDTIREIKRIHPRVSPSRFGGRWGH